MITANRSEPPFATLRVASLLDADNLEIMENNLPSGLDIFEGRQRLRYPQLLRQMESHGNDSRELIRRILYRPDYGFSITNQHYYERGCGLQVKRTPKDADHYLHADAIMCGHARMFDVLIVAGGDIDLAPFVPFLKMCALKIEVWSWDWKISDDLRAIVDEVVLLDPSLIVPQQLVFPMSTPRH